MEIQTYRHCTTSSFGHNLPTAHRYRSVVDCTDVEAIAGEANEKVRGVGWVIGVGLVLRVAEEARVVEEAANADDEQADAEELTALEPEVTTQEEEEEQAAT